jgi:hypothetical protein
MGLGLKFQQKIMGLGNDFTHQINSLEMREVEMKNINLHKQKSHCLVTGKRSS